MKTYRIEESSCGITIDKGVTLEEAKRLVKRYYEEDRIIDIEYPDSDKIEYSIVEE